MIWNEETAREKLWGILSYSYPFSVKGTEDWSDGKTSRDGHLELCDWDHNTGQQIAKPGRPFVDCGYLYQATDAIHDWFVESNIRYRIRWVKMHRQRDNTTVPFFAWVVEFTKLEHLIAFKLRWHVADLSIMVSI